MVTKKVLPKKGEKNEKSKVNESIGSSFMSKMYKQSNQSSIDSRLSKVSFEKVSHALPVDWLMLILQSNVRKKRMTSKAMNILVF